MSRNRVAHSRLPPYACICLIEIHRVTHEGTPLSFVNRSTGFFVAPRVIVTAGHSLQEGDSRIQRLEIYPHQNATAKSDCGLSVEVPDFTICKVPEYHNPHCFVKDDFGVIILKNKDWPARPLPHFEWRKGRYAKPPEAGQPVHMAGYPIDRPDFELWEERGKIVEVTDRCLLHPFTTTQRNSGSPIWTYEEGTPRVVGIHVSGNAASCGARPENRPYGSAVLITEKVFDTIKGWMETAGTETGDSVANGPPPAREPAGRVRSRRGFLREAGFAALGTSPALTDPGRRKEIVVHHVFFYLKDPQSAQDEASLLEGLAKLTKISTVRLSHIGRPAHTSGGEIEKGYSVSWLCFFKNLIEEEIYQTDPIHVKFQEEYAHLWERRVVYDTLGQKK